MKPVSILLLLLLLASGLRADEIALFYGSPDSKSRTRIELVEVSFFKPGEKKAFFKTYTSKYGNLFFPNTKLGTGKFVGKLEYKGKKMTFQVTIDGSEEKKTVLVEPETDSN